MNHTTIHSVKLDDAEPNLTGLLYENRPSWMNINNFQARTALMEILEG